MIHPDTELVYIGEHVGRGVRATKPIPRGTVVWARDVFDLVYTPDEIARFSPAHRALLQTHGYRMLDGRTVLCADAGRFINHSCDPSIRGINDDVMVAIRDLDIGDEITCDYAECHLLEPLLCRCGSTGCRGVVGEGDLYRYAGDWIADISAVVGLAAQIEQPVIPFVIDPGGTWELLSGARPVSQTYP